MGRTRLRLPRSAALATATLTVGIVLVVGLVLTANGGSGVTPTAAAPPPSVTLGQIPEEPVLPTTFDPVVLTGQGDAALQLSLPELGVDQVMLSAEHSGTSNFVVWTSTEAAPQAQLAFNQIGGVTGSTMIDAVSTGLQVRADGSWRLTVAPVETAPGWLRSVDGSGNAVLRYQPGGRVLLTSSGTGKFALRAKESDGPARLLVTQIGDHSAEVDLGDGPTVLIIEADGEWSLRTTG